MDDLKQAQREFARERDWEKFHTPKNLTMALIVEAAELVEHFQWLTEEESMNLPPEKLTEVQDEIADVLNYITRLADILGIDPIAAAKAKMIKNAEKYPVEKSKGRANKYTELD